MESNALLDLLFGWIIEKRIKSTSTPLHLLDDRDNNVDPGCQNNSLWFIRHTYGSVTLMLYSLHPKEDIEDLLKFRCIYTPTGV
jgi:hypothetical protein